jgi:hypothetical protein
MLWAYRLPLGGDRSREVSPPEDWRRYAKWRRSVGESRTLFDARGHLIEFAERSKLAEMIGFAIHMGWDAIVVARPLRCVIALSHDDIITVQSRRNPTMLSAALYRFGLTRSTVG